MQPTAAQYTGAEPFDPLANLIDAVLRYGDRVPDRTGTGTLELFGTQLVYPMQGGRFPLCTLKKTSFKNILVEILWIISGRTDIQFMHDHGAKHWDPWLPKDQRFGPNDLGRVYGVQWRNWMTADENNDSESDQSWTVKRTDQLANLVKGLREDPHGRRHLVTAWNPGELDQMALPPCHLLFQCHVNSRRELSLQVYQRSADLFIGVPYDVGMYGLLLLMLCEVCNMTPGTLIFNFGSSHVYLNHIEQAHEMIGREHRAFPVVGINPVKKFFSLDDFTVDDFWIKDYNPHPFIKADVAV